MGRKRNKYYLSGKTKRLYRMNAARMRQIINAKASIVAEPYKYIVQSNANTETVTANSLSEIMEQSANIKNEQNPESQGNAGEPSSACVKTSNKRIKLDDDDPECDDVDSNIEDEYSVLTKEYAIELMQMDPEQQFFAKRAITYILMEGRLGLLNSNSVHINNKVPGEHTAQKDPNVMALHEFFVMRKGSGESRSVLVSQEIGGSNGSSLSLVDTGSSSKTASHKTATHPSHVKSKPSNEITVSASQPTTTSVDASSFDNGGSNFIVASHTTAALVGLSSLVVKTKAFDYSGTSSVIGPYKIAASDGSTSALVKLEPYDDTGPSGDELATPLDSSTLLVKSEPCDDIGSTLIIASHKIATPVRRSHIHIKSEANSPP